LPVTTTPLILQPPRRSVLVAHSATMMYDLVWDVDRYCTFLPWCGGSKILKATKEA